ncbi:MAG: hypothetical protein LBU70_07400 [Chitinispirillales bacterium]|nr:hypothetical protein [Chitinispirillales bacterium]
MESSNIAMFVNIFNVVAVYASIIFAICGILIIFVKKTGKNIFKNKTFFRAFCIASVIAFAAELTFFNFQYYLRYFSGPEVSTTTPSTENPNIIHTTDGTYAEASIVKIDDREHVKITFQNLNRKITSIFTDVAFSDNETAQIYMQWVDEEGIRNYSKQIYKYLFHENYSPLQSRGKVSELMIFISGYPAIDIISVTVNKPIPFYFSGLRLLVVSFLFFAIIIFLRKKLRAKATYYLFDYKFDPANKKQNISYALMVTMLILYIWICAYTTPANRSFHELISLQYNQYLVDAIIEGRTWLDFGNPERRLNAERPYDPHWLEANGYEWGVDWITDWAWYNGKFYSYFGIVPALILYVPYTMITGNYLSIIAGTALFISIATLLLALLWRHCVKKFMPNARFAFYLLGFLALFFAGSLFCIVRFPVVYAMIQSAGFMFMVAGVLLLLKSIEHEKTNHLILFFACLCLALTAGSRPNLLLASFLVPMFLWKYRSWKLLLFIMIPYTMVAIPLCIYNYVRFDSIFEFGNKYCIHITGGPGYYGLQNPIATAITYFMSFMSYLFLPNVYSLYFPFVTYLPPIPTGHTMVFGAFMYREIGTGIINFPIVFCLYYYFKNIFRKNRFKQFNMLSAYLIVAMAIMFVCSVAYHGRYLVDFAIFIILPSLFCAYLWCNDRDSVHLPKTRMKVTYVLLILSILVGLFLFVTGLSLEFGRHSPHDPVLYRYLEHSLGIFRQI